MRRWEICRSKIWMHLRNYLHRLQQSWVDDFAVLAVWQCPPRTLLVRTCWCWSFSVAALLAWSAYRPMRRSWDGTVGLSIKSVSLPGKQDITLATSSFHLRTIFHILEWRKPFISTHWHLIIVSRWALHPQYDGCNSPPANRALQTCSTPLRHRCPHCYPDWCSHSAGLSEIIVIYWRAPNITEGRGPRSVCNLSKR